MKDIASRIAGPDINEFLKNQKTGRVLPDVESANDGSEPGGRWPGWVKLGLVAGFGPKWPAPEATAARPVR